MTKNEKKIVWFIHEGQLSGANLSLLEYLKLLKEKDFRIYVITPRLGEFSKSAAPFVIQSYQVYFYSWTIQPFLTIRLSARLRIIIRNWLAQKKIGKLLRQIKPDYVATNTITIDVGALAAKKHGIKHLWFVHEFGELDHGFTFKIGIDKARKKILSLSHLVVVNSLAVLKSFPLNDKVKLVSYSIPSKCSVTNTKRGLDNFRLLMLGQIAKSKNQPEAINAVGLCRKKGYNITLSVYGNIIVKEYGNLINDLIKKNGIENFVNIYPQTSNICEPFSESHALLMCSGNEAFGRVTVEAMKCGLPVIASNRGGSIEIVNDGINGYIYEAGNLSDLADKIIKLYHNYAAFDHEKIAEDISTKFNEINTWKQLKEIFE